MRINRSERVNIMKDDGSFNTGARVVEIKDDEIVLEIDGSAKGIDVSDRINIATGDATYKAVVRGREKNRLVVEVIAEDRRAFFRIDDSLPVKARKADRISASRFLSLIPERGDFRLPIDADSRDDALMALLQEVNQKLDYLINQLILKDEGIRIDECKEVNLSATGMRFEIEEDVRIGDIVEVKMMLPSSPPVAIQTYGEVVRVKKTEREGKPLYEVGLKFTEMTEEVREEIIQYTLKRQREIIRRKRQQL
ncbi:MAG TPA: PilZ domain-containing protein [Nitrospirae bacterium]|nr:PilZ domain-containing protein [Nitrospirota bacterium]